MEYMYFSLFLFLFLDGIELTMLRLVVAVPYTQLTMSWANELPGEKI